MISRNVIIVYNLYIYNYNISDSELQEPETEDPVMWHNRSRGKMPTR